MQVFMIKSNFGMKINASVNLKNRLIKAVVIRDVFGILEIVNVSVINHVMLQNI